MTGAQLAAAVGAAVILGAGAGTALAPRESSNTEVIPSRDQVAGKSSARAAAHTTRTQTAVRVWVNRVGLRKDVAAIAEREHARVGVAVRSLAAGALITAGSLPTGVAWSTIKVPLVLARYRLADERHENDRDRIDELAARALTRSDNAAAAELFADIETAKGGLVGASRYVGEELGAAGDHVTKINTVDPGNGFSTYGQTQWSLSAGTQFYRQLARACVPPRHSIGRVLTLMGSVIPSQRWGIGAVTWPRASTVRFKGGWGPDQTGGYLVRQFGIVQSSDGRGFAVALIARPDDRRFGTGVKVLNDLAAAVAGNVRVSETAVSSQCG